MELSPHSLNILIANCRYPTAIFNGELELICSNEVFKQNYEFEPECKSLKILGINRIFNIIESEIMHLPTLFANYKERKSNKLSKDIFVNIKPLTNDLNDSECWLLTIQQTHLVDQKLYVQQSDNDNKFRLLADYMPQIVWITNPDGFLDYCNKRWENYTGLTFEETLAGKWISVIPEDELDYIAETWNKAFQSGEKYEAEFHICRAADGMYRWHLVRGYPVKNEKGEVLSWFGTSTDIDDFKKNQENLRKSEIRYRTLIQSLNSIYWTVDPSGKMVLEQPSWETFSGQNWDEYNGEGWLQAIHPDDREDVRCALQHSLKERTIYQSVARIWSVKANEYLYCLSRAAPMIDDNDVVLKWIGSCLDINEQKQTEHALKEVTEQLSLALDSANVGVWSRDLIHETVTFGKKTHALLGLNPDMDFDFGQQKDFINIIHPLDRERISKELKSLYESKSDDFELEYRVIWPDDSVHLIVSRGKLYKDAHDQPTHMVGVCIDVTESKKAESLVYQSQLNLAKEAKQNSVAEMASMLAHEINQPLGAISTFLQGCIKLIEDGKDETENILYALKESNIQTERIAKIIHRIKNSVRKKTLTIEEVDLYELVEDSIRFINFEKNDHEISIFNLIPPDMNSRLIDKIQIHQVIINLLRNSSESLQLTPNPNREIFVSCFLDQNEWLIVEITDNGPGFSPQIFENLEFFPSTKENGMGIGLSICRSIIEDHGGKLTLSNLPQGGASVQFTLPLLKE